MELLQGVLNGDNIEVALDKWKETDASQVPLQKKTKEIVKNLPDSKVSLIPLLSLPLFSLNLSPNLIKKCIKFNLIDVLEALIKYKGAQISGKSLGSLFNYLLECPINYTPAGSCYKPYKNECKRQRVLLKRSERIRYYLLGMSISHTRSSPLLVSVSPVSYKYFSFMLKYLLSYPNEIPSCPKPSRFIEFLNGVLNCITIASPIDELSALIEEYILYTERVQFIHTLLTSNPETFPTKPLSRFSTMVLE